MKNSSLREIAKFMSGLVAADFLSLLWLSQQQILSTRSMGMLFPGNLLWVNIIFDIAVLIILVHYGWHLGKIPRPKEHTYLLIAGIIFAVIAAVHIVRLFLNIDLAIDGWEVPIWLSWVGVLVSLYLAYASFVFAAKAPSKR